MGKKKAQKVFLVVVHHKHGENYYLNATREGAIDSLYEYVEENWREAQDAFSYRNPKRKRPLAMPKDKYKAIELYFELQGDTGDEWYELDAWEVGP